MRALRRSAGEPPHVAVLPGGQKRGEAIARLGTKFRATETDRIKAEFQRAVADERARIARDSVAVR